MDNKNPYETDFYNWVENIGAEIEKLFCEQYLTPKQRAIFDDIETMTIYLMQPNQRDDYICQVIDAIARSQKILEFGDKAIEPIKPHYLGLSFGKN
jgi:hypothetical protein